MIRRLAPILSAIVPAQSARGRLLHDYAIEPLSMALGRKGFTHESRNLYTWSKARHVPGPEQGLPRRVIDRASDYLAGVADRWATEADERDQARRGRA